MHTALVLAHSLFLSITDVKNAVSGRGVIAVIKHEKKNILIRASFAILSCLFYSIVFRKSHLKSSTTYRISGFGSLNPFAMILLSLKEMVGLISSVGNHAHASNIPSKLAIGMRSTNFTGISPFLMGKDLFCVFGCIAKQFLQIFLLSADYPFIEGILCPKYIQRD